ncbi:hypothetical protein [Methylobacterium fujisawaense]
MPLDTNRPKDFRRPLLPPGEAQDRVRRGNLHLVGSRPERLSFGEARVSTEKSGTIEVTFSRALTDAELRFFREVCSRTAPLMDGVTD